MYEHHTRNSLGISIMCNSHTILLRMHTMVHRIASWDLIMQKDIVACLGFSLLPLAALCSFTLTS